MIHRFFNCGIIGRNGPTQRQIDNFYNIDNIMRGRVLFASGIQEWRVPKSAWYRIEAVGARGSNIGTSIGGRGTRMIGDFFLIHNQVLRILVGNMGQDKITMTDGGGGGGGGTFVENFTLLQPLIVAGGGGGAPDDQTSHGQNALITQNGGNCGTILGGINGLGGNAGNGRGGAGYFGNSSEGSALAFRNGGVGAAGRNLFAGFGGGGGGMDAGGGGGGYSGGAGGRLHGTAESFGGGGGSFNVGINQQNVAGFGQVGYVIISEISRDEMFTPTFMEGSFVWDNELGDVILEGTVISNHPTTPSLTFTPIINLNGAVIHTGTQITAPQNLRLQFQKSLLTNQINTLSIILRLVDSREVEVYQYTIYRENEDTFQFIRRLDFRNQVDHAINASFNKGVSVDWKSKVETASALIKVPTTGKGSLNNITITADEEGTYDVVYREITEGSTPLGAGRVYEHRLSLDRFVNLKDIDIGAR